MASTRLQTDRIDIVPFQSEHITDVYVNWLNDKELMRYSEQRYKLHTKETSEKYLANFADSQNYFWALIDREFNGELIGSMTAYVDQHNNIADVGIMLGSERRRGAGYAYEAWSCVLNWLLNERQIRKVTAGTLSVNKPMLSIMKKSGMVDDGVRKNHYINNDALVDVIHMAIFNKGKGGFSG